MLSDPDAIGIRVFVMLIGIPVVLLPGLTLAATNPFVRKKSLRARSLVLTLSLLPSVIWYVGVLLSVNGWRPNSSLAFTTVVMLALVAAGYPGFMAWGRLREKMAAEAARPHSPRETRRSRIAATVIVGLTALALGALLWVSWH